MSHAYAGMANGAVGLAEMGDRRSTRLGANQGDLNRLQKNRPTYFKLRLYWTECGDREQGDRGTRDFQTGPSLWKSFMVEVLTLCDRWHGKRRIEKGYFGKAKVQCVMARAGALDLRDDVGQNLFRNEQGSEFSAETKAEASPIAHVTPQAAPHLLIHGDADESVPYDQSPQMQEALEKAGVDVALIRVPGGGHGPTFADSADPPDYIGETIKWFDRYLLRVA